MVWRSAPDDPGAGGVVLGSATEVLAALRLQTEFAARRRMARRARAALGDQSPVDALGVPVSPSRRVRNLDTGEWMTLDDATSASRRPDVVRNLDTGDVIELDDLDALYRAAPLDAFAAAAHSHASLRLSPPPPPPTPPTPPNLTRDASSRLSAASDPRTPQRQRSDSPPSTSPFSPAMIFSRATVTVRRRRRRGAVRGFAQEPLMAGPLLKRGKKLGAWKLRWYVLTVDGELRCYRHRHDVERKPPGWSTLIGGARVSVLSRDRLEQAARDSGVFGFLIDAPLEPSRELFAETPVAFDRWMQAFALLGACAGAEVGVASGAFGHTQRSLIADLSGRAEADDLADGSTRDSFGFALRGAQASHYDAWCDGRSKEVKRHAKQHERWVHHLRHSSADCGGVRSSSARASAPPPPPPPESLAIGGVPDALRLKVWLQLTGIAELMRSYPTHYALMRARGAEMGASDRQEIEQDLRRTFPNHALFTAGPSASADELSHETPGAPGGETPAETPAVTRAVTRAVPTPSTAPTPLSRPADADADADGFSSREPSGFSGVSSAEPTPSAGRESDSSASSCYVAGASSSRACAQRAPPAEPAGLTALRRVLLAYVAHSPNAGYCQALNYLSGMILLLTDLREEEAFWLLVWLCDRGVPDFYSKAMTGIRLQQNLFSEYVRAALPQLSRHLERQGLPLSIASTRWFMCLYVDTLPAQTILRVWDTLILRGPLVLIRVGAALLKMAEAELMGASDFCALAATLQRLGSDQFDADRLFDVAYRQLERTAPFAARRVLDTAQAVYDSALAVTTPIAQHIDEAESLRDRASSDERSEMRRISFIGRRSVSDADDEMVEIDLDDLDENGGYGHYDGRSRVRARLVQLAERSAAVKSAAVSTARSTAQKGLSKIAAARERAGAPSPTDLHRAAARDRRDAVTRETGKGA